MCLNKDVLRKKQIQSCLVYPYVVVTNGFGLINDACRLVKHPIIVHAITIGNERVGVHRYINIVLLFY